MPVVSAAADVETTLGSEPTLHDALRAGLAQRSATEPKGRGRPRSAAAHEAILAATLDLLAAHGFDGLTIDAVAARARVGKATVYRRWASKFDLVVELLQTVASATPTPDTGDTREDLRQLVRNMVQGFSHEQYAQVLSGMASELSRNDTMAETFRTNFLQPRRQAAITILQRGIERGDLRPDTDVDVVLDCLVAPMYYRRMISGRPITPELGDALVDQVLRGVLASPS